MSNVLDANLKITSQINEKDLLETQQVFFMQPCLFDVYFFQLIS